MDTKELAEKHRRARAVITTAQALRELVTVFPEIEADAGSLGDMVDISRIILEDVSEELQDSKDTLCFCGSGETYEDCCFKELTGAPKNTDAPEEPNPFIEFIETPLTKEQVKRVIARDPSVMQGDYGSDQTVASIYAPKGTEHPHHCPLDGRGLREAGLGILECPLCGTSFVPTTAEDDGERSLTWAPRNINRQEDRWNP
jgi:hypothetical protein